MRELKFRAWDKENKEWYGESDPRILTFVGFAIFGECTLICTPPIEKLQHLEITQYTGLKDKNGVEIYEGDIVKTNWQNRNGVIAFILGSFCLKEFIETTSLQNLARNKWEFEVIGNIYQNPELLSTQRKDA